AQVADRSSRAPNASAALALEAEGDVKPANGLSDVAVRIVDGMPEAPVLVPSADVPPVVTPGLTYTATYRVLNGGSAPAGGDGAPPDGLGGVVSIAGMLPEGMATAWEADGDGWSCEPGNDESVPVCTYE